MDYCANTIALQNYERKLEEAENALSSFFENVVDENKKELRDTVKIIESLEDMEANNETLEEPYKTLERIVEDMESQTDYMGYDFQEELSDWITKETRTLEGF